MAGILYNGNVVEEINLDKSLGDKGIMLELSGKLRAQCGDGN
ncbi:hypothetical protein [Jeotgalicoccus sp. WY2]|nr:hypothetical protein [Jeotgalicoccus sp. WY2]